MVKLVLLLALAQISLIHGLPAPGLKQELDILDGRAVTISSDLSVTVSYSSTLASLQSASVTVSPSNTGTINTALPSGISRNPLGPSVTQPISSLAPISSTLAPGPTSPGGQADGNIFGVPIATDAPPQQITSRDDHPVKKLGIVDGNVPIETNKFFANLFLGSQGSGVWTHPYSLTWAKGTGNSWGVAVAHIERSQLAWDTGSPPRYFIGPIGLQHIVFSAAELGSTTTLSTENITPFSAYANLAPASGQDPILSLPLVQGMGFVTALYDKAKPQLNSGIFFKSLQYVEQLNGITYKYRVTLNDNSDWLIYATPVASLGAPPFRLVNSSLIEGPENFIGMIQTAKNPSNTTGEKVYDSTAGAYATNATISGSVSGSSGTYTLAWGKDGVQNQTLVMFALPHQVASFSDESKSALTDVQLVTTTKGYAKAVVADKITMVEPDLPNDIGFAPWASGIPTADDSSSSLSADTVKAINDAGALELGEDFDTQTRLDSMYYSGKGLAKFATIIYTLQSLTKNSELAAAGLVKLKDALNVFVNNTQPLPLVYDTVWKGVVSSGTYKSGDTGLDFGNTLYNDHHFHYGYFVYTAAVIGFLDPTWLDQGTNKAWTNTLVRDFANPSTSDPFFPFQRSFDWVNGHSWAKGLFESGDGKDQESTSEDTFATFALKMWGRTIGDANMEARANLQLAVTARSLSNYFLLQSDNTVQPPQFIPNKVTGILFENKVDHTTYFGANTEYIEGIHMIPINPSSAYTRPKKFVQEEWDTYFSNGRADNVTGGWKGILYANLALIDPATSYKFFSDPDFDLALLDGGASKTWYLAYSATLAGNTGASSSNSTTTTSNANEGLVDESDFSDVEGRSSDDEWGYSSGDDSDWSQYESDIEGRGSDSDSSVWDHDTQNWKTEWEK